MQAFLWLCFEVFSNLLDIVLFVFLINRKLELGRQEWKKDTCFVLLMTSALTYFNHSDVSYTFILTFFLLSFEAYALIFKKGSLFARILWPAVANVIYFLANNVNIALVTNLPDLDMDALLSQGPVRVFFVTFYMLMVTTAFALVARPKANTKIMPTWMQGALLSLVLFSVVFAGLVFDYAGAAMAQPEAAFVLSLATSGFFIMSASCLFLFDTMATWTTRAFELQTHVVRADEEQKHLTDLLTSHENIRGIRHDMRQHLQVLGTFAEDERWEELKKYLQQLDEDFSPAENILLSGHQLLDALVSAKMQQALTLGFTLTPLLAIPEELPFSETELCSVLGNLLDNALEAVQKLPIAERYVALEAVISKGMWAIMVANASNGTYQKARNTSAFLSTKTGPSHGIGLKRIQSIVEAREGQLVIEACETRFTASIYVPLTLSSAEASSA